MKFTKMQVTNFMSVEDSTVDFDNLGLVLIQGNNADVEIFDSNGAGKSTLFSEAPTWALYGETIRGQKGDTIINRSEGKNAVVSLTIVDDYGVEYVISRHRKHHVHKNHVLIYCDGENITPRSDKDADQFIIDLLQMDYTTFTNSIMFGQGMTKMFASSTDSEQKKILEKMLQIDIFKECQDIAKSRLQELTDSLTTRQSDISMLTNQKESEERHIQSLQHEENKAILARQSDIKDYKDEIEELAIELLSLSNRKDYSNNISNIHTQLAQYSDDLVNLENYKTQKHDLDSEIKICDREATAIMNKIAKKEKELADLVSGKNVPKTCSQCGQDLPLKDTTHLQNHIKEAIKNLQIEQDEQETDRDILIPLVGKLNKKIKDLGDVVQKTTELNAELARIDTATALADQKYKSVSNNLDRARKRLEKLEKEDVASSYKELIKKCENNIESYNTRIKELRDELSSLLDQQADLKFWVDAFGNQGIKSLLLDSVTPFLNTRANYYLAKLADSTISVKFNTQAMLKNGEMRDKFSVEVLNESGDDSYKGNSGGEKRRVDVAVNMALQDLINSRTHKSIDLIVYDEVYEGLDAAGCEQVVELLKEKASQFGSVVVITHNDNLKQLFDKSLTVSKKNGKTRVLTA
ncbi:putative DNA double-strand break repair Rad50 ATPase [Exiguobacterium phage vB_EalM-132]|nr:putative DNA double-strand break repair Rad50 ATPase [Exiguobacterium phage vB_EalM-132]